MFRVIIAGSRGFADYNLLARKLDILLANKSPHVTIVSGGARGADRLGERYAQARGYRLKVYPAEWNKHGRSAGYRRNETMARNADALVAFWDGQSRGTRHMIQYAQGQGLPTRVIRY